MMCKVFSETMGVGKERVVLGGKFQAHGRYPTCNEYAFF